jgi:hypothetical protein
MRRTVVLQEILKSVLLRRMEVDREGDKPWQRRRSWWGSVKGRFADISIRTKKMGWMTSMING